jgi:hypothetical protein
VTLTSIRGPDKSKAALLARAIIGMMARVNSKNRLGRVLCLQEKLRNPNDTTMGIF